MELVQATTVTADGLGLLIGQFVNKPRMQALGSSWLDQVQDLEDAIWSVFVDRAIDNAVGVQLDGLGNIVGQERQGMADANYRVFVKARIRANRSSGRIEDLLGIAALILGPGAAVKLRELYPLAVQLEADDVTVDARVLAEQFLKRAKAATVLLRFIFSTQPAASTLKLGSTYGGVSTTTSQRIDSTHAAGTGGVLAGEF